MPVNNYDIIVAGVGSMGSAACFFLADKGYKVLGLEHFDTIPHENGSHSGQSRIIRKAYFEHPDYVPLLERAYENWNTIEQKTGETLFYKTGLLYIGPAHHPVICGVKEAAVNYNIQLERAGSHPALSSFRINRDSECLLEPGAGFLLPEKCISLYIKEAIKKGAVIHTGEKMIQWERYADRIQVITNKGAYQAKKLIITAGAWAGQVIKQLNLPLKVTRQVIAWVEPENPALFTPDQFPCWLLASDQINGAWYGFPYLSGSAFPGPAGLKFALHHPAGETDPDQVNRDLGPGELKKIIDEAKEYFIPAGFNVVTAKTCLYTNSTDGHFIIDHLPGYEKDVAIACGFSGHGFKFVSVIGEILAELAIEGRTRLPIEFLGLKRFNRQ